MKQSINRNILWTELFVSALENLGIKHACISPGSRNTPIVIALQNSKKINTFVHIDERSSGFFALGLANKTNTPVVIVTTSGTAVVELYPAIVEAFQQKTSLLICTADRPEYLLSTGANQTINQIEIFRNHIINSFSLELPSVEKRGLDILYRVTKNAYKDSVRQIGPVHINFPFDFPFEPSKTTNKVGIPFLDEVRLKFKSISVPLKIIKSKQNDIYFFTEQIQKSGRRLVLIGPGSITSKVIKSIFRFAKQTNSLIFADGLSGTRFIKSIPKNLLANHASFLRSREVLNHLDPDLIIQIGSAPTSNPVLDFFKNSSALKILINQFGELKDPSRTTNRIITAEYSEFFESANLIFDRKRIVYTDKKWLTDLIKIDELTQRIKIDHFEKIAFPFEGKIINQIIELAPPDSNIFVSNSLPVRDLDAFASKVDKPINIFSNRGASGIDGITSTAAGILAAEIKPTFLIIGDLAFYHDLTSLLSLKKYSLPLIIIILNNSGGGIFEFLPISKEKIDFENYFKTPLGIDFEKIVAGFKGNYSLVKSWKGFNTQVKKTMNRKIFSVIEVKIDSKKTLQTRKHIWNEVKSKVNLYINEN